MIAPRTIFGKLLLLFLGFGALMTCVFIVVMRVSHVAYHLEFDQLTHRALAQQYVAANLLVREPPLTAHNFAGSLRNITSINPSVDVYVLDARGTILAASAPGRRVVRRRVALEPVARVLDGHSTLPILGDDPVDADERGVFSVAPLAIPDCPAAYLYVMLNRHDAAPVAAGLKTTYAIGEGAGVLLAAIALALAGSVLFLRLLTRRLATLQESVEQFRGSRYLDLPPADLPVDGDPDDEIGRLRSHFVELAIHVGQQMRELQKTDEMRRELVSNVSHDLRTPLATLQAHLETLSMGDGLPAEERRRYLAVSLQQCRRLIRLVEQLLEVASLDAGQVAIAPEPFQLGELAHDLVTKWSMAARRAGVAIGVEQPKEGVPPVVGDPALIGRVIDNLVNNALRHAGAGGRVTMHLMPQRNTVRMAVHDSGSGIPDEERGRVFDRLYRGDKSRSSESGDAGLGLSIARGILELHGRTIDFVSGPPEGTTFFFELPVAVAPEPGGASFRTLDSGHESAA